MTTRPPVSFPEPIWYNAQQVDETDLTAQQVADNSAIASLIDNHVGDGVLPEALVNNVIFNSSSFVGFLDGLPIQAQNQPTDTNLGNQLSISLIGSQASGRRRVKVGIIGLDFQDNLQYEVFYFDTNEIQVTSKHFTQVLLLLFNDFIGNDQLSFNLGGTILITEASPMTISRDVVMVAQNQQPSLFFRDFFLDFSVSQLTLQSMLQAALPLYNINNLNIFTQELTSMQLSVGDVTTQIGEKFLATTDNIQKVTLLLSTDATNPNNWTGDLVVSIYPLESTIDCPTDFVPNLPINFPPFNIPLAQISYNYTSLLAAGIALDTVPQPVDFVFSNTPLAGGNLMTPGQYYAVTLKRSGAATTGNIFLAVGSNLVTNSWITTFSNTLWVDITTQNLWFEIWTDAAKITDGQAYDAGNGVTIPKTTIDPLTQATVDYSLGAQEFVGSEVFMAVLAAVSQESNPVPDQRTGNPVNSRQQFVPQITLMNSIDVTNLEKASNPLILGSIQDTNIRSFQPGQGIVAPLYSATIVEDFLLVRIVDDPTDAVRFNTLVTGLATSLLNGDLIGATIVPDVNSTVQGGPPQYRIASAKLCSMILGDVDGNGIIDENDLNLLNSYLGYNLNATLPVNSSVIYPMGNDGYGYTVQYINGYNTLIQPFANLFGIVFQLMDPTTNIIVAYGYDGVLVANPNNPRQAQFTSASINFNNIIGLSSYTLVINMNGYVNNANYGGWNIVGLDSIADVLTIQKVYLTEDAIGQMLRADINGDFVITQSDGYLLNSYIERVSEVNSPPDTYPGAPAPTTNPYSKIGTRFNVIEFRLEQLVDRNDDYTSDPNQRDGYTHPIQDIFLNDGYLANYNFYFDNSNDVPVGTPIQMSFTKQLIWDPSLVVSTAQPKLIPATFVTESGFTNYPCSIQGIQCNVYPIPQDFDPGKVDFFIPNNLIIGEGGQLQNTDNSFYKVDFEVGTIVLEIPDGLFGSEQTVDILNDFIADYTGNGATRLGFPSMRFADCSYVSKNAFTNDQIRVTASVQSFSPNTNGLSSDGYYGAIVDGKMGVSLNPKTGFLTLNFTNLYQDPVLTTLSTKVLVSIYLKKSGFNNAPLYVDSGKVQNILSLVSVFSGANVGGLAPTTIAYTPTAPSNWVGSPPTTVQQALDRIAAHFPGIL
ncbi:MAG TPA: hypothetical protein VII94_01470 [Candidatus Saccharimonadales bacterium]